MWTAQHRVGHKVMETEVDFTVPDVSLLSLESWKPLPSEKGTTGRLLDFDLKARTGI